MGQIVHYSGANLYRCGELRLIPGNNDVPEKVWNEVKDHPLVKMRIEKAIITPRKPAQPIATSEAVAPEGGHSHSGSGQGAGAGEGLTSLNEFNAKDAEDLVKETFDLPTLERWKSEETRKGVIKAIEAQIESLKIEDGKENEGKK